MNTSTIATGRSATMTCGEAVRMALDEAMARDPTVIVFGEDVADPEGGGVRLATKGLSNKYGEERVRSTPISEQAIIGAAVGAAIAGMRPVAEIMLMNFLCLGLDQLINHAAKTRYMSGGQTTVPLTVRTMSGAGLSTGGQHSDMLEAWLAHSPGLKVVVPSNPTDYRALLLSCIFDDNPCVFIENTLQLGVKGPAADPNYVAPIGKARIVHEGTDVTLIGYGRPMLDAAQVATKLAGEGVSVELIDLRTIVPMDEETILKSVAKTGRAVILHEAVKKFGVGAEIACRINEELYGQLHAPVQRIGMGYTPVPYTSVLEKAILWSPAKIEAAIRKTTG
jgi:acetoin:2,6-dichlorophenolindophenol oxidoreductase subunit beta